MSQSQFDVILKIIAKNPPSIAIAGGVLLILFGGVLNDPTITGYGWNTIIIGALLQAGWLFMIYYRAK